MKTIVWFRQDLRLHDNPALCAAANDGDIIPVYIYDSTLAEEYQPGGASRWWLHHALLDLASSLQQKLIVRKGDPKDILQSLAKQYQVNRVCWNRMYEKWARQRDESIKVSLKHDGYEVKSFNGSLLWEPMSVMKKDGTPYKVFTPFYRKGCLSVQQPRYPLDRPALSFVDDMPNDADEQIQALKLLPTIDWDTTIAQLWNPSEKQAKKQLQAFIHHSITDYAEQRNLPAVNGTSQLSPFFHFGQLSPNQAWYAIHDAFHGNTSGKGVDTYLSELGWREFSYYLLFHFDDIGKHNFNPKFDAFPWRTSQSDLQAWQRGHTGIPIIDAGMRELWQTGYMHNRVRMIVGSFLVKNLLIDWRKGERWFWDCLLDADSASNAASWQWVAGSGADAAPYFRIFNPVLQGEKFDKQGDYVRKYCPELAQLPNKYIHKPWEATDDVLQQADLQLGKQYPKPIVDLKQSRQRALDAFEQIKSESA